MSVQPVKSETEFVLYPNPATNLLNIQIPNKSMQPSKYQIINTLGAVVANGILQANGTIATIPIKGLMAGVYNIQVLSGTGILWRKSFIVIQE